MAEPRACTNCKRVKKIIGFGLCGSCYHVTKGLTQDTPEWEKALAKVKERLAGGGGPRKIKKGKKAVRSNKVEVPNFIADLAIIDELTEKRDGYLAMAKKLDQAIDLLSA